MNISLPPKSVFRAPKRRAYRNAVDTSQHSIGHPMWDATDNAILNDGWVGVFAAVYSSGCTSWKFPQITILAFFLAGPPWTLGLVTRISRAGKGVEVAFPFAISSHTANLLNDTISSQTAYIHSCACGLRITLTSSVRALAGCWK